MSSRATWLHMLSDPYVTLRPHRIDIEAPMVHISTMNAASAVRRRLENYWKMEAACAGLFPILALAIVDLTGLWDLLALLLALFACCSLLVVGALYWRAALRRLSGDTVPMAGLLADAHRLRFWLLALCVIATTVAVAVLMRASGSPPRRSPPRASRCSATWNM